MSDIGERHTLMILAAFIEQWHEIGLPGIVYSCPDVGALSRSANGSTGPFLRVDKVVATDLDASS